MARTVALPAAAVLALAGGAAWLVGSSALDSGTGTVVLAAGIAFTVWLVIDARRSAWEQPLERWRTRRLLRLAVIGLVLVVGGGAVLGFTPYGELAVPLGFLVVGALLLPASSLLESRATMLLGATLMVLAAAGGLLAMRSVGEFYPRGLVGLGSGVLFWLAAAHRAGLLARLRGRASY